MLVAATMGLAGCTREGAPESVAATPATPAPAAAGSAQSGCLPDGQGRFEASLHGALTGEIAWGNADMQCEGGLRPDGNGVRVVVVGKLPPAAGEARREPRQLRFIIGIDLIDTAAGPAQVLPTNLTVIVEGESQLFATRGDDRCAVEDLRREPLADGVQKISGRGYCVGPAAAVVGNAPLVVPTFSFTGLARVEEDAGSGAP